MNTLSYKTVSANKDTATRNWYIVDADGETAGRLFSKIAAVLRGKNKTNFTPHVDTGDNVIVINADKIRFTGDKVNQKIYLTYSLYPGGQKSEVAKNLMARRPERVIERGVRGMLPKNKLGNAMIKKMFVYAGDKHPHAAQQPQPLA
jgi:large subunit ribosomal protein L13